MSGTYASAHRRESACLLRLHPLVLLACFLLLAWVAAPVAAQPMAPDLDQAGRMLVDQMVADRANVLSRQGRRAEERESALIRQLSQRERDLRVALKSVRATQAERDALSGELGQVQQQRTEAVETLAARDISYRFELAEYRRAILGIAASPSPERRQALQRYADGDRAAAFELLKDLAEAEERARLKAAERMAQVESARSWREVGAVALDLFDRGEKGVADVIPIWNKVVTLDPQDGDAWLTLGSFHWRAGHIDDASRAAETAVALNSDADLRARAYLLLGGVRKRQGRMTEARQALGHAVERVPLDTKELSTDAAGLVVVAMVVFCETGLEVGDLDEAMAGATGALVLAERSLSAAPQDASLQMTAIEALTCLGRVHQAAGNPAVARELWSAAIDRTRLPLARSPGAPHLLQLMQNALALLGDLQSREGDTAAAVASYDELAKLSRQWLAADPSSADARLVAASAEERLGDLLLQDGDATGARDHFLESLKSFRTLAAQSPQSVPEQLAVTYGLLWLAMAQSAGHDTAAAHASLEESLRTARSNLALHPESADARRALSSVLLEIAPLRRAAGAATEAGDAIEEALRLRRAAHEANSGGLGVAYDLWVALSARRSASAEREAWEPALADAREALRLAQSVQRGAAPAAPAPSGATSAPARGALLAALAVDARQRRPDLQTASVDADAMIHHAWLQLAETQFRAGQPADALASLRQMEQECRAALARQPPAPEADRMLARSLERQASLEASEAPERARTHIDEAIRLGRQRLAGPDANRHDADRLAQALELRARLAIDAGRLQDARADLEASVDTSARQTAKPAADAALLPLELARRYTALAGIQRATGSAATALATVERSLAGLRPQAAAHAVDGPVRLALAAALEEQSLVFSALGQRQQQVQAARDALMQLPPLTPQDLTLTAPGPDPVATRLRLASTLLLAGDAPTARPSLEDTARLLLALRARPLAEPQRLGELAEALRLLSITEMLAGAPHKAMITAAAAVGAARQLQQREPANPFTGRGLLWQSLTHLGRAQVMAGQSELALLNLQEALGGLEAALATHPDEASTRIGVATVLSLVGHLQWSQDKPELARQAFVKALDTLRTVPAEGADARQVREQMAFALRGLALIDDTPAAWRAAHDRLTQLAKAGELDTAGQDMLREASSHLEAQR